MNRRAAISLVELLVVMSACTLILSLVGVLLHRTMRAHSEMRTFFDAERTALRLARQFREDVHQAASATPDAADPDPAEGSLLELKLADGARVVYRQRDANVSRLLYQDGRQRAREDYRLAEGAVASVQKLSDPVRLELQVDAASAKPSSSAEISARRLRQAPVELRVEAVLGLDKRFAAAGLPQEEGR